MTRLRIDLTLTAESALSIGAGGSAGTIADKSIVRDGWGRPVIPGSQVKGKMRWALEQVLRGMSDTVPSPFEDPPDIVGKLAQHKPLGRDDLVHALFGSVTWRSPLYFADLQLALVGEAQAANVRQLLSQIRPSVAISRRRGTAEDARLLFQEVALEGMAFHADDAISGDLRRLPVAAEQCAALLWAALKLTNRWGGAKSRGLGWVDVAAHVYLNDKQLTEDDLRQALHIALMPKEGQ